MAPEPMVAVLLLRNVVNRLVGLGIDRAALLAEAGVTPDALGLTRMRLPWSVMEDVLEAAERLTGDDRLGFHLGVRYEPDTPTLPELIFLATPRLGDAIRQTMRMFRLWSDAEYGTFLQDPPRGRYLLRSPVRRAHVHLHEHGMTVGINLMRRATGVSLAPREVRFAHPREADIDEYEAYFGCPVRFGAGVTEMELRPEQLDLPFGTSNPLFASHFRREAEAELAALTAGRGLAERLRELLQEDLEALRVGESSLESSAVRLRTSARTLQRGLALEGTTFARELDTVRRDAAERMLLAGMDIAEASWRLGYAEPPVFHRAFKRWTGATPEQYRQRRTGG